MEPQSTQSPPSESEMGTHSMDVQKPSDSQQQQQQPTAPSTPSGQNPKQNPIYQVVKLKSKTKQTRVLVLHPSKYETADLYGTLEVVDLDADAYSPFHALSYVWGLSPPKDSNEPWPWKLHCGTDMPDINISENCKLALQRLRPQYHPLRIWVDAICINQIDDEEKNVQLEMMGEIYGRAASAFIWVGAGTKESDRVMDALAQAEKLNFLPFPATLQNLQPPGLMQQIGFALRLLPPYTSISLPIQIWRKMQIDKRWKKQIGDSIAHDFRHKDLTEFFKRPWFHRGWTFQECVLPSKLLLVCGKKQLPWDAFIRGAAYLTGPDNATEKQSRKNWFPLAFQYYGREYRERRRREPVPRYDHTRPEDTSLGALWRWDPSRVATIPSVAFENVKTIFQLWMALPRDPLKSVGEDGQSPSFKTAQDPYYRIHEMLTPQSPRGIYVASLGAQLFVFLPLLIGLLVGVKTSEASSAIKAFFAIIVGVTVMLVPRYAPVRRTFNEAGGPPEREGQEEQNKERCIEAVVQFLRKRDVTNPQDLSYAMYGILKRLKIKSLSKADNKLNPGEVHRRLVIDLLNWHPGFLILLIEAGAREQPKSDDLKKSDNLNKSDNSTPNPTWVPKLSNLRTGPTKAFGWYFHKHARDLSQLHAAPSSHPSAQIRPGGRQLVVKGIILDYVLSFTDRLEDVTSDAFSGLDVAAVSRVLEPSLFLVASWIQIAGRIVQSRGGLLLSDLIYLTLTEKYYSAEVRSELTRAAPENRLEKDLTTFARLCMHLCSIDTVTPKTSSSEPGADGTGLRTGHVTDILIREEIESNPASPFPQEGGCPTMLRMFIEMVKFLAQDEHRLFVMASGRVGRAPRDVLRADQVAIVAGVPAPLLLRRCAGSSANHEDVYEVVGPVFVHEWMDGSAFREEALRDIVLA